MIYLNKNPLQKIAEQILRKHCDFVATVQGKFKEFPYWNNYDNIPEFNSQMDLRNFALSMLPEFEYFFYADDDELFFGNWNLTKHVLQRDKPKVGWVREYLPNGLNKPRPRVLYKSRGLQYTYNHFTLEDSEGLVIGHKSISKELQKPEKERCMLPLMFLHLRDFRADWYLKNREIYYASRKTEIKPKEINK